MLWTVFIITVEPLSNDHPHQRPSLLYDHISCDGQCFLFVRSLTDDHPSNATNDQVIWNSLPHGRPLLITVYFQESRVALQHPFPMVDYYNVALRHLWSNSIALNFLLFWRRYNDVLRSTYVASLQCCQPAGAQTCTFVVIQVLWTNRIRGAVTCNYQRQCNMMFYVKCRPTFVILFSFCQL